MDLIEWKEKRTLALGIKQIDSQQTVELTNRTINSTLVFVLTPAKEISLESRRLGLAANFALLTNPVDSPTPFNPITQPNPLCVLRSRAKHEHKVLTSHTPGATP